MSCTHVLGRWQPKPAASAAHYAGWWCATCRRFVALRPGHGKGRFWISRREYQAHAEALVNSPGVPCP